MSVAFPRATYQDVLDAPPHKVAQVVRGVLHVHPRPTLPHAVAAGALNINIGSPFGFGRGGPGGWWILPEPELHLGEDIVVPDIAGWRKERMPKFPDAAYCAVPPDWVCEVLSPSTRQFDTGEKKDVYSRERVRHLWMADPDARVLEAFEWRGGGWFLIGTRTDDMPVSLPPFEAISFDLGDLWYAPE